MKRRLERIQAALFVHVARSHLNLKCQLKIKAFDVRDGTQWRPILLYA
jgi:hypothetical protein